MTLSVSEHIYDVFLNLNYDIVPQITHIWYTDLRNEKEEKKEVEKKPSSYHDEANVEPLKQEAESLCIPRGRARVGSIVLDHSFHFHWIFVSCLQQVRSRFKSS